MSLFMVCIFQKFIILIFFCYPNDNRIFFYTEMSECFKAMVTVTNFKAVVKKQSEEQSGDGSMIG